VSWVPVTVATKESVLAVGTEALEGLMLSRIAAAAARMKGRPTGCGGARTERMESSGVIGDGANDDLTCLPLPKRSKVRHETGALTPSSRAIVLSVASGTTTATVSPSLPKEIIITGPADPFQPVFPAGPEGKTGGSDPCAGADLARPSSRHATMARGSRISRQRLVKRGITDVICRRPLEASRVSGGADVALHI